MRTRFLAEHYRSSPTGYPPHYTATDPELKYDQNLYKAINLSQSKQLLVFFNSEINKWCDFWSRLQKQIQNQTNQSIDGNLFKRNKQHNNKNIIMTDSVCLFVILPY